MTEYTPKSASYDRDEDFSFPDYPPERYAHDACEGLRDAMEEITFNGLELAILELAEAILEERANG